MKKYIGFLLLLVSFTSYGQFVNYTNINGRYKWIAGKFDSTFTLPSGTTPSLRVGGGTGPGALFYNTSDSVVYQYTGSQWRPLHGSDTGRIQIAYVRNTTASPMTTGQVVYINGSTGNVPTVALANNKQDSTSAMTFGFVRGAIPVNGFGWITTFGPIDGINTNAYTEGEVIYLDSIAGQFTHDKPQAPYHMVTLGYIVKKSGNGIIFVKIQNGYELEELHNVRITSPVRNNGILAYDSVARLWKDTTLSAIGGVTGSGTSGQVAYWTGTSSQSGSSTFLFSPTSELDLANSVTASGAIARGGRIRPTLTAAANNDVLVGLDIAPTFTNGAFTGVTNLGLRITGVDANINGALVGTVNGNQTRLGFGTLTSITSGLFNTAVGVNALNKVTSSSENSAFGQSALSNATTSSKNSAFGAFTMQKATTGSNNAAFGAGALIETTTGFSNTAIGVEALQQNTTGGFNVAIGQWAGRHITGGINNTISNTSIYIGYYTKAQNTNQTNQIVIGHDETGLGSNTTIIGNSSTITTALRGNLILGSLVDGGQRLQVTGDVLFKGSGNTGGTTALTVQNSDGTNALRVRNDGVTLYGSAGAYISPMNRVTSISISGEGLLFNATGNTAGTDYAFAGNNITATSGALTVVGLFKNFIPTSGTATYTNTQIQPIINQTGGANGITRGLYVNPTLTAAADWRSIEWSNNSGWGLYGDGSARNFLRGKLGIGTTDLAAHYLNVGANITGVVAVEAIKSTGQIQSDVTAFNRYFSTSASTQNATFTIGTITHYSANQGTLGASSTVTNQIGFEVGSSLIGAGNNFGFYGNIASAANRWNLYMNGTAANYMNGNLLLGSTTDGGQKLQVTGTARVDKLLINRTSLVGSNVFEVGGVSGFYGDTYVISNSSSNNVLTVFSNSLAATFFNIVSSGNTAYFNNTIGYDIRISGTPVLALGTTETRFNSPGGNVNFVIQGDTNANLFFLKASTDNIGIGTTSPNASAILELSSTTKGFLPPVMTNAQMVAIATPAAGLVVYDTTNNKLNVYDGTNWVTLH